MRIKTTLALLMAAGFATATARAQDTAAVGAGNAAQRSPSTTANDVTTVGVPGAPGQAPAGLIPGRPAMAAQPVTGFNDALFAAAAASAGMSEVAMSRIASERGGCDEVKMFGQKMVADHTKANQELKALAAAKGIPLPMGFEPCDRAGLGALMSLEGEAFDKAYICQQLAAHIGAVNLFEAETMLGRDPQAKAWAEKTLSTLKEHLTHVKRMHHEMEAKMKDKSAASR